MNRKRQANSLYNNNIRFTRRHVNHWYIWPDPLASAEQCEKFLGLDIGQMSTLDRWREIKKLESAITWLMDDDAILFYHPGRITKRLAWAADRIKKLKARLYDLPGE